MADRRRLLTVRQVADQLCVCTATIYQLLDQGALPYTRVSHAIRIHPSELATYLCRVRGGEQ